MTPDDVKRLRELLANGTGYTSADHALRKLLSSWEAQRSALLNARNVLTRLTTDEMGGTPDLFAPDFGVRPSDDETHWDISDAYVRAAVKRIDSALAPEDK